MPAAADGPAGLEAWEERLWREGVSVVAGTDEAGRGPLAGPVVAAAFAVLAHDDEEVRALLASVADSKQMTAQQREEAYAELTDPRFKGRTVWAIAEADVEEIDKANILQSSLSAMARAVQALEVRPDCVLVDGCNRPPGLLAPGAQWTRGSRKAEKDTGKQASLGKWFTARAPAKAADDEAAAAPWRPRSVEAVIDGDARVPSISAASVLAKVHRDRVMEALHEQFPVYGFASHKGYGTEAHMEAIKVHGVCPQHRRSFGPIREALGLNDPPPEKPAATLLRDMLARSEAGGGREGAPSETPPAASRAEAHLEVTPRQGPSEAQPPATGQKVSRKRAAAGAAAEQPGPAGEDRVVRRRMRSKGQDGAQA